MLLIFSLLVIGRYSRVLLHWAGHRLPEGYGSWALPAVLLLGLIPVFLGAPLWAAMAWPAVLCLPFATGRIKGIFMAALLCFSVSAYAEQRGKDLLIPLSNGPLLSQLNLGYGIAKSEDLSVLEAAAKKTGSPALALALAEAERRAGDVKTSSERLIGLLDNPEAGIIAYNQLACLYLDFDQIEEAVKTLETAAALNPTGPEVFYNLSQAYNGARRFEDSDRTYEKASQLDPEAVARFDLAKKLTGSNYYVARMPIPAGLLEQDLRRDRPWTSVLASGRYQFALFIISFILLVSLGLRNQTRLCRYCGKVICPKCRPESRVSGVCGPCHQIYLSGKAVDPKLKMAQRGRVRRYHILSGWSALVLNLLLPGSGLVLKEIAISGFMLMLWPMAFITSIILMRVAPEPLVPGVNLWPVWLAAAGAIYLVCGLLSILLYLKLVSVEA